VRTLNLGREVEVLSKPHLVLSSAKVLGYFILHSPAYEDGTDSEFRNVGD